MNERLTWDECQDHLLAGGVVASASDGTRFRIRGGVVQQNSTGSMDEVWWLPTGFPEYLNRAVYTKLSSPFCGSCVFWQKHEHYTASEPYGYCRRMSKRHNGFPVAQETEWCGEYTAVKS